MRSVKFYLLLFFMGLGMAIAQPCWSQTMSNTAHTITLSGTCLNGTLFSSGSYTLTLTYTDDDAGVKQQPAPVSATVAVSGSTAVITVPNTFTLPTPASNGTWSLPNADMGSIFLNPVSGAGGGLMGWSHDNDGNLVFSDCGALPVVWGTRLAFPSGTTAEILQVTQLESGTSFLEYYRSTAGINGFYKIGQLPAAGNSSTGHFYTFIDSFPANGNNRYYLKMLTPGAPADISDTFGVFCSGCSFTPPTPVVCNYTINGPDHICDFGVSTAYSLSDTIPNYNSIAWSIDQPAAAHLASNPAYDLGHVTLLRKDTDAVVALTATLSGCSNPITKYISIGSPKVTIHDSLACGNFPNFYAWVDSIPGATNYEWTIVDSTAHVLTLTNGVRNTFNAFLVTGDIYYLSVVATNACGNGQESVLHSIICSGGGSGLLRNSIVASPNPTPGQVSISLVTTPVTGANGMAAANAATDIAVNAKTGASKVYQIRVLDKMGNLKKTFVYPGGVTNVSIDLSSLPADIYTLQVFDNITWTARQIILAK